jgi:hypothetical protein
MLVGIFEVVLPILQNSFNTTELLYKDLAPGYRNTQQQTRVSRGSRPEGR